MVDAVDDRGGSGPGGRATSKRGAASASNKIRLSAEEERIYRKVDGARTVQAIIDATGLGEFEVCRILFDLLNRNIVAPAGKGAAKVAPEEEPTESIASADSGLRGDGPRGPPGRGRDLRPVAHALRGDGPRARAAGDHAAGCSRA